MPTSERVAGRELMLSAQEERLLRARMADIPPRDRRHDAVCILLAEIDRLRAALGVRGGKLDRI